jgi:hypothetical protein
MSTIYIDIEEIVNDLQQQVFDKHGIRTDVHIKEGVGILVTPENAPLVHRNVVLAIPWHVLMFGNITIN